MGLNLVDDRFVLLILIKGNVLSYDSLAQDSRTASDERVGHARLVHEAPIGVIVWIRWSSLVCRIRREH